MIEREPYINDVIIEYIAQMFPMDSILNNPKETSDVILGRLRMREDILNHLKMIAIEQEGE